jgi:hypothetical protein
VRAAEDFNQEHVGEAVNLPHDKMEQSAGICISRDRPPVPGPQMGSILDFAHASHLVILEGLLDFSAAVHHEWTVPDDRFIDGFASHQ